MINYFPDCDNNYYKIISYEALLPNLRYKSKDRNIYYIHKTPIKITLNLMILFSKKLVFWFMSCDKLLFFVTFELLELGLSWELIIYINLNNNV